MQIETYTRRGFLHMSGLLGLSLVFLTPERTRAQSVEHPYYTQFHYAETETGTILFAAGSSVDRRSLDIAREEFLDITQYRPDIQQTLAAMRFILTIIPNRTPIRTLPQFSSLTDDSVRGWGGTRRDPSIGMSRPIAAIAEENLLRLPNDQLTKPPYNIMIAPHEYGHVIRRAGLTSEERSQWINEIYPRLKSAPGFPRNWQHISYAFTNFDGSKGEEEMFAEITRCKRQGYGQQIRRFLDDDGALFFSNLYGPF